MRVYKRFSEIYENVQAGVHLLSSRIRNYCENEMICFVEMIQILSCFPFNISRYLKSIVKIVSVTYVRTYTNKHEHDFCHSPYLLIFYRKNIHYKG